MTGLVEASVHVKKGRRYLVETDASGEFAVHLGRSDSDPILTTTRVDAFTSPATGRLSLLLMGNEQAGPPAITVSELGLF